MTRESEHTAPHPPPHPQCRWLVVLVQPKQAKGVNFKGAKFRPTAQGGANDSPCICYIQEGRHDKPNRVSFQGAPTSGKQVRGQRLREGPAAWGGGRGDGSGSGGCAAARVEVQHRRVTTRASLNNGKRRPKKLLPGKGLLVANPPLPPSTIKKG